MSSRSVQHFGMAIDISCRLRIFPDAHILAQLVRVVRINSKKLQNAILTLMLHVRHKEVKYSSS